MGRATTTTILAVLGCALSGSAAPAAEGLLDLPRLTGPIVLDGRSDDAAWESVPPLPLTMYAPTHRGTPTQRTEIRVAYDDEALYASGRFYDSDPQGIRINSLYRDRWNGDDAFAIYVDAFNDNLNAKWFGVTAAAMRFDLLVSDDGARPTRAGTATGRPGPPSPARAGSPRCGFPSPRSASRSRATGPSWGSPSPAWSRAAASA